MWQEEAAPGYLPPASWPHQEHLAAVARPTLAEGASRAGSEILGICQVPQKI